MKWNDLSKIKPSLGQDVLIYRQGYGAHGNYYFDYFLASYVRNPYDKRKYCFVPKLEKEKATPWIYTKITHWMPLPEPPEKIKIEDIAQPTASSMVRELFGNE